MTYNSKQWRIVWFSKKKKVINALCSTQFKAKAGVCEKDCYMSAVEQVPTPREKCIDSDCSIADTEITDDLNLFHIDTKTSILQI